MIKVTRHTVEYAPFEEGADERERIAEYSDVLRFATARQCANYLRADGIQSPSVDPGPYNERTWLSSVDPYTHPHTGVTEEESVHAKDVHPRVWAAIVASVSREYTRYQGPYYA